MIVKHDYMLDQIGDCHPKLRSMLGLVDAFSYLISGRGIVVTSLIRDPIDGMPSLHPVGCAFDMRVHEYKVSSDEYKLIYTKQQLLMFRIFGFIMKSLVKKFDVNFHDELEGTPNAHIHWEWEAGEVGYFPK